MKKFPVTQLFSRLGVWTVPLVSVTSLPFFWTHWQEPKTRLDPPKPLPSLSQIPPAPPTSEGLASPTPLLKTPKPKQPSPKPQAAAPTSPKSPPASKPASPAPPSRQTASLPPAPPAYTPPPLEIRVAVVRDAAGTTLGASSGASLAGRDGRVLQSLSSQEGLWVQPDGASLRVGDWQLPGVIWVEPAPGSLVYVGDRWYRGKLLLVSQGSTLLAVNYVPLEHYLYSVVGSEMHANAPAEALKAQAIAARSYALVHIIRPASPWYDLGNTQRWQVYKGTASEYATTHQAVNDSAGQVLSHRGGVVESLYAATDEIVARAHGGRGMSQTGAYELARGGYDYQQILANYYPGVGLARLVLRQ